MGNSYAIRMNLQRDRRYYTVYSIFVRRTDRTQQMEESSFPLATFASRVAFGKFEVQKLPIISPTQSSFHHHYQIFRMSLRILCGSSSSRALATLRTTSGCRSMTVISSQSAEEYKKQVRYHSLAELSNSVLNSNFQICLSSTSLTNPLFSSSSNADNIVNLRTIRNVWLKREDLSHHM